MDPFGRLPFHLLLVIAKDATDLPSLRSLCCASPAFSDLVRDNSLAAEIVEAVISCHLPSRIGEVVRATCLLLGQPPGCWADLVQRNLFHGNVVTWPLPRHGLAAGAVRRVLALSVPVRAAAHRCLATTLVRCRAIKPQRMVDATVNFRRETFWRYDRDVDGFLPMPPFVSEPHADADPVAGAAMPLTWVEEKRAVYGVWKLAYFSVARAVLEGASCSETTLGDSTGKSPLLHPLDLWYQLFRPDMDSLRAVLEIDGPGSVDPGMEEDSASSSNNSNRNTPCLRVADLCRDAPLPPVSFASEHVCPMPDNWTPGFSGLGDPHEGLWLLHGARVMYWSPLRDVDFAPFLRLGLLFWDVPRLHALGVLSTPEAVQSRFGGIAALAEHSDLFTLRSLLTQAQVAALEKKQKRLWVNSLAYDERY